MSSSITADEAVELLGIIADLLTDARITAWDEGYNVGFRVASGIPTMGHSQGMWSDPPNPYK
jgi:hypothetical protein